MNALLKTVVSLSLSGSLLIAILLFLKPLVRDRLSKRWQYYIWLVVLIRLLLPFAPEGSLIDSLFQPENPLPSQTAISPAPQTMVLPSRETKPVDHAQTERETPPVPEERETSIDWGPVLLMLWLAVALILLVRKITAYRSFVRYLKAGCAEVWEPASLDALAQIGDGIGVKRPVELYVNPLAASPMLLGILHPCIVLPGLDLPEETFRYTVLHELIHYRRRDLYYKWLVQFTICLHWFNPLVWQMGREIDRACELACDEAVLNGLDAQGRRAYGTALLCAAETAGGYRMTVTAVSLHEGAELLKERLEAIMKVQKGSKGTAALSLLLTGALTVSGAAAGAYSGPAKPVSASLVMPERAIVDTVRGWKKTAQASQATIDALEAELDRQQLEEYAAHGITKNGKNYYYQGALVHIFLDRQQNRTVFYTLQINPAGTVNLKVTRDGEGNIQRVETIPQGEMEALLRDMGVGRYAPEDNDLDGDRADGVDDWDDDLEDGVDDWDWDKDDKKDASLEQQRLKEYAALGVTTDGKDYYYQGTLARIFLDQQPNGAFYVLEINQAGAVDLKTVRGADGRLQRVERMAQAEAEALLDDMR